MSSYKCLFFHTRNCPIREQMDITNDKLREETITLEKERDARLIQDAEPERIVHQFSQTMADWLIGKVCALCPHREK